ncbi:potassium channel subfamily T member 2-like isoform X9 [Portunus trituberculatus]|uniref:potassium channel subfamily T member 2-like isoform X9 n=1 Tax=Portunus trituberculatus TaxID=210409 RepID=UPI001E1D1FE3|nr:potassium channel subfamily T member 2-like isoform X9 [Portunus trituberculatus]
MPKEFQHPFYKMPWLLEEEYGSLEDLDCLEGRMYLPRTTHHVLPLWADDDDDEEPPQRSHGRPYNDVGTSEESVEVVAPLIDPRRAVLLPGYTGDHFPVWRRTDPSKYVNGASRPAREPMPKVGIPKIEMQSPGDSDEEGQTGEGAKEPPAKATKGTRNSDSTKSQPRMSLSSLRRSSTLTRINELLQRARSEVFEGEDGLTAREKIRHLLRNSHVDDVQRVRVEYYVNENTFKERLHLYFVKNQRSSLRIRIFNLLIKLLTCVLYIVRVCRDIDPIRANCYDCPEDKEVTAYFLEYGNKTDERFQENPVINWQAVLWVNRTLPLWAIQVVVATVSLSEALLLAYLNYKGNIWQTLRSFYFILELVNTIPFILTICWSPLRNLFVPVFLNCWLAKHALENMFNDLHRAMQRSQSALSQQLMILCATFMCLVFTSVCGIQHFQRAGHRHLNLFQAVYYVIVTFSTVGYGDFVPDIWPSQLFMVIMICVALIVLPTQFEQLAFTWMERKKLGGTYSAHRAQSEKHVVVCSTNLQADTIMDFLNEFYAHPHLQDYFVVLLSPMELDPTMKMILQVPMWAQRVIYIQGSCLKDGDLTRARMSEAEACFILAARQYTDKTAADEHTILRSWAVKDFAPNVPQYVQIFRPENKLHVKFAEHVVCEDELKYALLANNCMSPGISTLVTLLLHTSRGQEGQASQEDWHRLYGKCSGNEIYHIKLSDSRFFGEYEGKSFTYASFHSHRKYGVALVGVRPAELPEFYEDTIMLNPGPRHIMKKTDLCFYMSITKEENSAFVVGSTSTNTTTANQEGRVEGGGADASLTKDPERGVGGGERREGDREEPLPKPRSGRRCVLLKLRSNVSVNELQKKLEEEVDRRREKWEEEQGRHITREEALVTSTKQKLIQEEGESMELRKSHPRHKLEREDTTKSNSPSLSGGNFLDVPRSDTLISVSDKRPETRRPSILPVPDMFTGSSLNISSQERGSEDVSGESDDEVDDVPWRSPSEMIAIIKGFPPVSPYIGVSPTLCYLLKEKKPLCCLQLAQSRIRSVCDHCTYRSAKEYNWQNRAVILAADYASNGIYNFIIPLRAHFRKKTLLNPIILLLERRPDVAFLDAISWFPLVYWMLGSIDCLDDLLRAGINVAENVVVVNKELNNSAEEDTLSDCNTIVAVQTMFKFFPNIKIITELSQSSNMRFMQFRARDAYALHLSKMEKGSQPQGPRSRPASRRRSRSFRRRPPPQRPIYYSEVINQLERREKERGSHISYMFRLPFAAGSVFSASMLDTLLYQAFVKDYLITFVRLLLGVDQAPGSGFLTSMKIGKQDLWIRTYGRLYQKLCSTTCEIPIGIYRTIDTSNMEPGNNFSLNISDDPKEIHCNLIERAEIAQLVRSRMQSLALPPEDYDDVSEKRNSLSFVIINPSCDLKLEEGDIVYLIRPSPFSAQKTFERHNSRRKSNISLCGENRRRSTTFVRPPPLTTAPKSNSLSLPDSPQISPGAEGRLFCPPEGLCGPLLQETRNGFHHATKLANRRAPLLGSLVALDSLHVPMSPPTGYVRGRSNSLRVDDILMRRSNSLRFGLEASRKINSFEELGISPLTPLTRDERTGSIKIPTNGSIGLEVTPPEECGSEASVPSIQLQGTIV